MTVRRLAGVAITAALVVGGYMVACRPADAAKAKDIDTAELARRQQRIDSALGMVARAGTAESTLAAPADLVVADTVSMADSATSETGNAARRTDSTGKTSDKAGDKGDKDGKGDGKKGKDEAPRGNAGAIARWVLPRELDEISGIALTPDGRLLAHGDERAQVSEIDYRRGVIVKQFVIGNPTVRADLEGITVANDVVFMTTDKGVLYEFREGVNGSRVDYLMYDTRLGKECEFEGLAYDPKIHSLLLACKEVDDKRLRADSMVIYRWKLSGGGQRISRITAPLSPILQAINEKEFHPAEITIDPNTGNYVIVASIEGALVEITPAGEVISARKLAGQHDQPESIAITKDGVLIIGDEAGSRRAFITLYPWPR